MAEVKEEGKDRDLRPQASGSTDSEKLRGARRGEVHANSVT